MLSVTTNEYRGVALVVILFVLVNATFILSMPLLPFIDLPNHLAEATIYRNYNVAGNVLSNYYQPTPWYFPNTFHTVFCSLFPNVESGNKIFEILCIVLLQVSVFIVIRQLNGNLWYGLLAALFTYNYNFTYGFVGFAISTPTLILLFYLIIRDFEKNNLLLKIGIASLLILLFLMHAQNALFGLVLFGGLTLFQFRKSVKQLLLRGLLIPMPLIILIFTWWFNRGGENEGSTTQYLLDYYSSNYFTSFLIRFNLPLYDNFQLYEGWTGLIAAALIFTVIIIPLIVLRPWKSFQQERLTKDFAYASVLFGAALLCYILLPDQLPGQTPIFQRFCTTLILSLIILGSILLKRYHPAWLAPFVVVSIVAYNLLWFEYIFTFNRINASFTRALFEGVDNRSRMAGLIYDHKYRGRKVYIHFPNYFLVWNKGIVASKIIDYRFGVVRRVATLNQVPFYREYLGDGYRRVNEYKNLDYLLAKGKAPVTSDKNLAGFTLVKQADAWRLYKKSN